MRIHLILPDAARAVAFEAQALRVAVGTVAAVHPCRVIDRLYAPADRLPAGNGVIYDVGKDEIAFTFFHEDASGAAPEETTLGGAYMINIIPFHYAILTAVQMDAVTTKL